MVRLSDRPDMTLDVYHVRKTKMQQRYNFHHLLAITGKFICGMVVIVHLKLTRN